MSLKDLSYHFKSCSPSKRGRERDPPLLKRAVKSFLTCVPSVVSAPPECRKQVTGWMGTVLTLNHTIPPAPLNLASTQHLDICGSVCVANRRGKGYLLRCVQGVIYDQDAMALR